MPPRRAIHSKGSQEPCLDHILERNVANLKRLNDEFRLVPEKIRTAFFYLLDGVANPLHTKACAATLIFALARTSTLIEEPGFKGNSSLSKLHGFWSILYNFLTAERTDQQFTSLVSEFSTCSCNVENSVWYISRNLHKEAKDWEAAATAGARPRLSLMGDRSHTWKFIHMLGGLLRVMMSGAKDASVTKGISKRWPSMTSGLLPLGPDQVVKSLIQWHRFVGDMVMRELLPGLLKMCGPLIHKSITRLDALSILVLEPIKSQLDKVLNILEEELAATTTDARESQLKDYQFDQLGNYLRRCLREVFRPPARSGVLMLDAAGATKALQLCSIFLYTIPLLQPRSSIDPAYLAFLTQHLSHFGSEIFGHFNLHLPDRPNIPLHPSLVAAAETSNTGKLSVYAALSFPGSMPSHQHIASAMVECRSTRSCSGPGCELTFKDKGSSFKTCAGCTTVGYCGRECQLRHWNAESGSSHKQACKILARILKERGGWKESTNSDRRLYTELMDLTDLVAKMQEEGKLSREDIIEIMVWAERSSSELNNSKYIRLEWHSGYSDYDETLARLVALGGPKPAYINRILSSMVKGDDHLMGSMKDLKELGVLDHLDVAFI